MADSPIKKIGFGGIGKENTAHVATPAVDDLKKPTVDLVKKDEKPIAGNGAKPDLSGEPLLRENPNRFVLFPIKYHEVNIDALRL